MIAIRPKDNWPWVCSDDRELPLEDRTVWMLGDMKEKDRVELHDAVMVRQDEATGAISTGMGTRIYLTLKFGLKGIREGSQLLDEDGSAVPFEAHKVTGQVTDEFLAMIPWEVKTEMYVAISARLSMEAEEKEE